MNYERQKEMERQREIDKTRKALLAAAIATKDAVEENARQAKQARIEQNESLKRQEKIADQSSFRSTVLNSIPLVSEEDIPIYIIQQISSRLSCFRHGYLNIEPDFLYEMINIEYVLENIIKEKRNTERGKNLIEKIGFLKSLVKNEKIDTSQINENIKSSEEKETTRYAFAFIFFAASIWAAFMELKNYGISHIPNAIFQCVFMNIITALFYYFGYKQKKISDFNKMYLKIESEIKPMVDSFKTDVLKTFRDFEAIKQLKGSEESIAKSYFKKYVFPLIYKEQSFLPPHCQLDLEEWENHVISDRTINMVKSKIENIESEIYQRFNMDWVFSYKMGFFADSKTAAQSYEEMMKRIVG